MLPCLTVIYPPHLSQTVESLLTEGWLVPKPVPSVPFIETLQIE